MCKICDRMIKQLLSRWSNREHIVIRYGMFSVQNDLQCLTNAPVSLAD